MPCSRTQSEAATWLGRAVCLPCQAEVGGGGGAWPLPERWLWGRRSGRWSTRLPRFLHRSDDDNDPHPLLCPLRWESRGLQVWGLSGDPGPFQKQKVSAGTHAHPHASHSSGLSSRRRWDTHTHTHTRTIHSHPLIHIHTHSQCTHARTHTPMYLPTFSLTLIHVYLCIITQFPLTHSHTLTMLTRAHAHSSLPPGLHEARLQQCGRQRCAGSLPGSASLNEPDRGGNAAHP